MDTSHDGPNLDGAFVVLELAYLGGLFDGEGFTTFRSVGLTIGITMRDLAPLVIMRKHFGKHIRYVPERGVHKPSFELTYHGAKAIAVLRSLLPYLRGKKDRIELILEYYQDWDILSKPGRKALIEKFDAEPLVLKYRKVNATGRPKGSKSKNHHGYVKKGYGESAKPLLL